MSLNVCPAAIVAAPVETVWELLQPANLNAWVDGQVERIEPPGPATVGQMMYVTARALGRKWSCTFQIEKADHEKHQLAMHVTFPPGMRLQEHVSCTPIDATSCRVQYG